MGVGEGFPDVDGDDDVVDYVCSLVGRWSGGRWDFGGALVLVSWVVGSRSGFGGRGEGRGGRVGSAGWGWGWGEVFSWFLVAVMGVGRGGDGCCGCFRFQDDDFGHRNQNRRIGCLELGFGGCLPVKLVF